ncbi:PREDICTED: uncharacterized protein LOC104826177 [Tarenaya hassleriana]|uniref:uncharacterized protein LOC104826177 n=1 Tax=Tarenaya hassleriana TaxID=28532 RepID=UPI00053C48BE|nr:PREDICTED: uncharacterized protein LOC104826177 [Tarenaya hassleriana]
MAAPTPRVLSKLLQNATGNVAASSSPPTVSSPHRFPLLQVTEIVPCLADDQWRSDGFFLKVSDSLHAAYVAVCAGDDADLIRSDEIQLGQLVYVRGGFHVENGCPVPVIRGLKPVPKRRPCFGNPSDLVSSDVLVPFTQVSTLDDSKKKTRKKKNGVETKRLGLDSPRKGWDQTPPSPLRRDALLLSSSSPRLRNKLFLSDKKASPKNDSPSRQLSSDTAALKTRNEFMPPKSVSKTPKHSIKSSSKPVVPVALFKFPLSDRRILWSGCPSTIRTLGKEVSSCKNIAFTAAVTALEDASAAQSLLNCLLAFGELSGSSQKMSAGELVHRFLDLYHIMQDIAAAAHPLLNNSSSPGSISSKHSGSRDNHIGFCTSTGKKNAASWVQAAVSSDLSRFSLFKEAAAAGEDHHHGYILVENSSGKRNPEDFTRGSKKSPRNPAKKSVGSPPMKGCPAGNRRKASTALAEELLLVSRQWFLKYLEDSLNRGFFLMNKEDANGNGNASLLIQLKKANQWLDDLIVNRMEDTGKKIEDLREKLQRFLLDRVEASISQIRSRS